MSGWSTVIAILDGKVYSENKSTNKIQSEAWWRIPEEVFFLDGASGAWMNFNDRAVKFSSKGQLSNEGSYVLFYQRT